VGTIEIFNKWVNAGSTFRLVLKSYTSGGVTKVIHINKEGEKFNFTKKWVYTKGHEQIISTQEKLNLGQVQEFLTKERIQYNLTTNETQS
jgi:hypothetical protein